MPVPVETPWAAHSYKQRYGAPFRVELLRPDPDNPLNRWGRVVAWRTGMTERQAAVKLLLSLSIFAENRLDLTATERCQATSAVLALLCRIRQQEGVAAA